MANPYSPFGRIDRPFWCNKREWPREFPGYTFLLCAFDAIGRAMFAAQWTGQEVIVNEPREPELAKELANLKEERIEEWKAESAERTGKYHKALAEYFAGQTRAARVRDQIANSAITGELATFWKGDGSGDPASIRPSVWNVGVTANLMPRFWRGRISLNEAVENPWATSMREDGWIFVSHDSLDRLLCGLRGEAVNPEGAAAADDAAAPGTAPGAKKRKTGRPHLLNWDMVREETFRLMDENGTFSADDPDWNAQARLENALFDFCHSKFGVRPGFTTLRDRLPAMLLAWEKSKAGK
ncbi:MAG: hypothetical protein ACJ8C8_05995 [Microvirga sp.]|jgi:hypothetical protein